MGKAALLISEIYSLIEGLWKSLFRNIYILIKLKVYISSNENESLEATSQNGLCKEDNLKDLSNKSYLFKTLFDFW